MIKKLFENRYFILLILPFLIGSLSVLSFQPFNLTVINFIIFPLSFYVIVYISKKSHSFYRKKPFKINLFLFGLFFGFGFYLSGVSWIVNSLTFDDNFKILIPFGLIFYSTIFKFIYGYPNFINWTKSTFNFSSLILFSGSNSFFRLFKIKIINWFSMEFMGL